MNGKVGIFNGSGAKTDVQQIICCKCVIKPKTLKARLEPFRSRQPDLAGRGQGRVRLSIGGGWRAHAHEVLGQLAATVRM